MIELASQQWIGKGLHRECYLHPDDPQRCIKVVVHGDQVESRREQAYYQLLLKRKINWDMLSPFYGTVATTLGEGAIFELVRDFDGTVSCSLEALLKNTQHQMLPQILLNAFLQLKKYLLENEILTMNLKTKNILFKRMSPQVGRLVIVDGVGNSDLIPLCNVSRYLAQRKILRKWSRFEAAIMAECASSKKLFSV